MSIASGFSIQRNDVINVPHRTQYETHDAVSGDSIYILRSKPDFTDKDWNWDIRMGEVRLHLDRKLGANTGADAINIYNTTATGVGPTGIHATEGAAWNANDYTEGSVDAGFGSVRYRSDRGLYGAIEFTATAQPMPGEKVEIKYTEHKDNFTGSDGGLLFQLAHDMCIHPYEGPELFQATFAGFATHDTTASGAAGSELTCDLDTTGMAQTLDTAGAVTLYENKLAASYVDMYNDDGSAATQRTASALWKVVREHRETSIINMATGVATSANDAVIAAGTSLAFSAITAGTVSTYVTIMDDFPLVENDLGTGRFRIAIDGKQLAPDDFVVSSDVATRKSTFKLQRTEAMNWVENLAAVNITVSYVWGKSIDVPYGALVGKTGLGPDQYSGSINSGNTAFPKEHTASADLWYYSRPFRSGLTTGAAGAFVTPSGNPTVTGSGFVGWAAATDGSTAAIITAQADDADAIVGLGNATVIPTTSPRHQNTAKIASQDLMMVEMATNAEFMTPFKLIYPAPTSNTKEDIKIALRTITDKFLVESDKGADLLSDSNMTLASNSPASTRKPQKWRMRFQWDDTSYTLKVNVATSYQLRDDMTISAPAGRDGIKSPVFREAGELCDVYQTPAIGRGSKLKISRAKQQWFKKSQMEDEDALSYPMSYKFTCTDHGIALFVFDQAAVDQDDDYAWLVVQRHVNQTTGEPEFGDKSPVHCVYSPSKRTVDLASLTPYYSTKDMDDLSKPSSISSALGGVRTTEGPTVYISNDASFFNGRINAIDFNGYGYAAGVPGVVSGSNLAQTDLKVDLFRGMTGNYTSDSSTYWRQTTYTLFIDISDAASFTGSAAGAGATPPTGSTTPNFQVGMFVADNNTTPTWGGKIKSWNSSSGKLVLSSPQDLSAMEIDGSGTAFTLFQGSSGTGDVTTGWAYHNNTVMSNIFLDSPPIVNGMCKTLIPANKSSGVNTSGADAVVTDLAVTGFNSLPRRRNTSIALSASNAPGAIQQKPAYVIGGVTNAPFIRAITETGNFMDATGTVPGTAGDPMTSANTPPSATFLETSDITAQFSANVVWPTNILQRMSTFKDSSASGTGVPSSVENINLSDYKEGDAALLDILYTAQPENITKVFESMIVSLDDIEVPRDSGAYILTYDEWTRRGDPTTVPRFLESLEAAGVTTLGSSFKIPNLDASTVPLMNTLVPGMDPTPTAGAGTDHTLSISTNNRTTGRKFFSEYNTGAAAGANVTAPTFALTTGMLVSSSNDAPLNQKLPGDVIWTDTGNRNVYMYDFWNKSLYFKLAPRSGATFSIRMINYQTSNPSQESYIISIPEDRNFPETNMNEVKTINRFVVREKDVMKPWDYHVSATMHEIDSHAIINPQEQLSITQGRNFVFSFPTQLTSQRFYYPESELDLICVSSADFSTQAGYVEINKYTDSDGKNSGAATVSTAAITAVAASANTTDAGTDMTTSTNTLERFAYGGHTGPDAEVYIWRKNARKYEGMAATLPNGNGMRIFMQVTGSSIRFSDATPATAVPAT